MKDRSRSPGNVGYFFRIATTANLFIADFDPATVDEGTGTVRSDAVTLKETEWLWYLYPVPRHLQFAMDGALSLTDRGLHFVISKMPIAVVRSSYLAEFLKRPPTEPQQWVLDGPAPAGNSQIGPPAA